MDLDDDDLSPSALEQLHSLSRFGLSEKALVLYGRWWQFEDWLRQLAYVELRARYGRSWTTKLSGSNNNQLKDAEWTHMLGRDSENPLAYLDFPKLSDLLIDEWELFKFALPRLDTWKGHASELNMVRRRIAHLRQAHPDDLARLEQALRDLERGAFITVASFNRRRRVLPAEHMDPVADGWANGKHLDAMRLLSHGENQYDVSFQLHKSRRPWAAPSVLADGGAGMLWHADFYSRKSTIDIEALWRSSYFPPVNDCLLYLEAESPNHLTFTFSAVEDPHAVADAIGSAFDAVLSSPSYGERPPTMQWLRNAREISYKITSGSAWTVIDESTLPVSIFGTGGSVRTLPDW
ncbi:Swt1 family HEPN domain-containing protein [Arthrobacter sp. SAFR-179]|uniref:Swt1 family HEPN domain-containing protein n=1 Tax=Arthrobacter sp. SAFR-179 TaxID=3387279 RepID=UPI003F7CA9DF